MSENEPVDVELWAMRLMSVDELARYNDVLETIEREVARGAKFCEELRRTPGRQWSSKKEKQDMFFSLHCIEEAATTRNAMIAKFVDQVPAWEKLATMACEVLERLADEGMTLSKAGGKPEFFRLLYHQILAKCGNDIKADPAFRNVRIAEFLQRMLVIRLEEFAEAYRERGNPILAQLMEELADS